MVMEVVVKFTGYNKILVSRSFGKVVFAFGRRGGGMKRLTSELRRKHILQGKNGHLLVVTGRVWEVWPSSPQFTRPGPPVPAEGQTRMDFHSAILLLISSSTWYFQHPYDWWAFWVLCCQAPQPICWWLGDLARSMGPSVLLLVGLMGLVKLVVTVGVVVLVFV